MKPSGWNTLISLLGSAVLVSCGAPGVPIPPSLELAKPVTDLRAARKGDKVYLAWTVPAKTTDRQAVRHPGETLVCRELAAPVSDCKNPSAKIPPNQFPPAASSKGSPSAKTQASYTDTLPDEIQRKNLTAPISYAVSVENESGRSAGLSNQVQVPSAPTLPPPNNFQAAVKSDGVLLSWNCPPSITSVDGVAHKVRIYRREQGKAMDARISDAPVTDCPAASAPGFLDQTFEWEKQYDYRATVVTEITSAGKPASDVEGDDSPTIPVFAHDVFPPAMPIGLQAVFSGVGQAPFVDLVWSPDPEPDLAGYNVFRHEENQPPVKLNSGAVKTPSFRDSNVQSGKRYFYAVSAFDERGNESAKSEETSEQVPSRDPTN